MDVLTVCRHNIWKDLFDIICSWNPLTSHLIKVRQNWCSWKTIWNGCKEGEWNSFYYDDCLYTISSKLYLIFDEVKISSQNIKIFLSAVLRYLIFHRNSKYILQCLKNIVAILRCANIPSLTSIPKNKNHMSHIILPQATVLYLFYIYNNNDGGGAYVTKM